MLGSLISAGASLLGGLFGQNSQDKQMQMQINAQREFAQNGIQWKVADAGKAGVHPLYALGANTHSFSPIGIGGNPMGEGIAQAGQDIGRAIQSKATTFERAYQTKLAELQLRRGELENTLLASQIARLNQPAQPPGMPAIASGGNAWLIDGQGNGQRTNVQDLPLERIAADRAIPYQEPGAIVDVGHARTAGGHAPVMSQDVKQRLEEDFIGSMQWNARNRLGPYMSDERFNPPYRAPPGKVWVFNPFYGEYQLVTPTGTPENSLGMH